jgi:amino acid adenylation domain-containing protein
VNETLPPQPPRARTAWLIGDGTMLIHCAELLLERGFEIRGVITASPQLRAWAVQAELAVVSAGDGYVDRLAAEEFAYLFSIVNLRILPPEVLALPTRLAVNFHDALLPRYAGVNATSWAILNGEAVHGVTWHVMEQGADTGDVVKFREVVIAEGETSASLNMKCYEAGIETFRELLDDIAAGKLSRRKQDVAQRSYFARYRRPAGGGLLCWGVSAERTEALHRCFDFGPSPNDFGSLKLPIDDSLYVVKGLKVLGEASGRPPGSVVQITTGALRVTTQTKDLVVTRLASLDGRIVPVEAVVEAHRIRPGTVLKDPSEAQLASATVRWQQACRHDAGWAKDLATPQVRLPDRTDGLRAQETRASSYRELVLELSEPAKHLLVGVAETSPRWVGVLASLLAFLGRMAEAGARRVSLIPPWAGPSDGLDRSCSSVVPLVIPPVGEAADFAELLAAVSRRLDLLVTRGAPASDLRSRYPNLSDADADADHGAEIQVELVESMDQRRAPGGCALRVVIAAGSLDTLWGIDVSVISEPELRRLWEQYMAFLGRIAEDPSRELVKIPLLTADEWRRVVVDMNQTQRSYPLDTPVHALFSRTAARKGDAVAVICAQASMSYRELDRRSSALAVFLEEAGIGQGMCVGVFLPRTIDLVVALLGVLKAGAAYVPLDPIYPEDRLAFMIDDSKLSVVLTTADLEDSLPPTAARRILVDAQWDDVEEGFVRGGSGGEPPGGGDRVGPDALAYVIYTSGSSGRPKGVQVYHRGLTNFLLSMAETPGVAETDKLMSLTTICFDIAALELYLPLIQGAIVELVPAEICRDGIRLKEAIEASDATVIQATPSTWQMLVSAGWGQAGSLRVLCGGEALPRALAEELSQRSAEVWNLFGPTETTIWSSCGRVVDSTNISIGRPIANTQFYVLDDHLNPTPIGVPGELYIAGDGVAAGYQGRPELTAARFLPDPFAAGADRRMYRTGDLVRYRDDGSLQYLNRIDSQIKIRGYRIELEEIEAALRQHESVKTSIAIVDEDRTGHKSILAYVVLRPHAPANLPETLMAGLRACLPHYMVPDAITTLERLPYTPNGKLDRTALQRRRAAVPKPRSPAPGALKRALEEQIAEEWQAVLGRDGLGVHDSFFDVGGDSVSLTRLVRTLGERFDRRFTSTDMFRSPTIHSFANFMRASAGPTPVEVSREADLADRRRAQRSDYRRKRQPP